jgi:hypothetical protein
MNARMASRYSRSGQGTGPWQGQPSRTRMSPRGTSLQTVKISDRSDSPAVTSSPEAMYPL